MAEDVEIVLPSLPLINNRERTLAEFSVPDSGDLVDGSEEGTADTFQEGVCSRRLTRSQQSGTSGR